ncbi:hypothetical protein E5676_scaffold409G00080 [Cucumis melo var. makuwa]|uniref:Uncharacterized protein n=1 Tax=Cucumis melo var. makuwa TaxID=1194695 RepID=A0A5A7SLS8_CUCMM|nr:hypothetical protein E6C27_scaffold139G004840 [Cucumis melo var. makuwa]TYK04412.1 hypothetical protein E5676_scaffold409G00080 [Cucumis melo var. makuwa]
MMIYYIKKKMVVNLGAIIRNSILSWMKTPQGIMPFPSTIEALCLKAVPKLLAFSQAPIFGSVSSQATLNQTITLHQNKEEERHLKTLNKVKGEEEEASLPPPPSPLKRKKAHDNASSSKKKEKRWKQDATINPKPLTILPLTLPLPPPPYPKTQPPHQSYQHPPPRHLSLASPYLIKRALFAKKNSSTLRKTCSAFLPSIHCYTYIFEEEDIEGIERCLGG